jgi:hypothetical protein
MAIASGINKKVVYKKETTWSVLPGPTGGQSLRNVTSGLDLKKDVYGSNEKRDDYQKADVRHGTRKIDGSINGELSCGTYKDFMAAVVRAAFVTAATTGALTTISAVAATGFARTGGSFITDGFKVGQVVRATGMTATGNNGRNLLITSLTATAMNGVFLDGGAAVAVSAAGASTTILSAGKTATMAIASHTDDSFSIEHWYSDVAQSEVFTGCKVAKLGIKLPATGMATLQIDFMGRDMVTAQAAYYTTPAAQTTSGTLAAVNGALFVGTTQVGLLTSLDFDVNGNMSTDAVVGSNTTPDVFEGPMDVTGNMTVYFQDATFRDLFLNETEASIVAAFTANNSGTADFMAFTMPRIKAGGATKSDGIKGLMLTMPFTALRPITAPAGTYDSTLAVQDSLA